MGEPEVVLDGVWKTFPVPEGAKQTPAALRDVSLAVERGELMVVVGPSGCGKSTTLRLVAGLDDPDDGTVAIAGKPMKNVPPQDRDVGMVFQGYALYPQMTVREILEFPLRMRKVDRAARTHAVKEAAELLRIEPLLDRLPAELSGGERQRVAMGRTIVRRPRVFLFDEPLSNLDAALRADIRLEIGALVRRLEATAIYVTHDHVEAMTLADRIAVMRKGRVLQCATPREIYERPATSFVGTFMGSPRMNLLKGRAVEGAIECGPFRLPRPHGELPERVEVGVRPEHVRVASDGEGVAARVVAVEPLGAETHLVVEVAEGLELRVRSQGFDVHARGDRVHVALDLDRVHVFDPFRHGARVEGG